MIKIALENSNKIEAILRDANGKAKTHVYSTRVEIYDCALIAEKMLADIGLPESQRVGAAVTMESGKLLPKAYKSTTCQTRITLLRRTKGWYLVSAERVPLYPNQPGRCRLLLTSDQDTYLVKRLRSKYQIH